MAASKSVNDDIGYPGHVMYLQIVSRTLEVVGSTPMGGSISNLNSDPDLPVLLKHHHNGFAFDGHLAVLICADGLERDDGFVFADLCYGRCCRNHVADKGWSGELHCLRQINYLSLLELVSQYRGDEGAAQHAVRDAAAEPRRSRKFLVKMYRVVISRKVREFTYQLVCYFPLYREGVAYIQIHIVLQ